MRPKSAVNPQRPQSATLQYCKVGPHSVPTYLTVRSGRCRSDPVDHWQWVPISNNLHLLPASSTIRNHVLNSAKIYSTERRTGIEWASVPVTDAGKELKSQGSFEILIVKFWLLYWATGSSFIPAAFCLTLALRRFIIHFRIQSFTKKFYKISNL